MLHTLIASFLFFNPLSNVPLGSFDSEVKGLPFLSGSLTRKIEKAVLPAVQMNEIMMFAMKQYQMVFPPNGSDDGSMLVRGRL